LRRQLEEYIAEELGEDRLSSSRNHTELRKIKKEMAELKRRLEVLQTRRTELEKAVAQKRAEQ
jgi:ubiquinone biosynthesis protein UbiJ